MRLKSSVKKKQHKQQQKQYIKKDKKVTYNSKKK